MHLPWGPIKGAYWFSIRGCDRRGTLPSKPGLGIGILEKYRLPNVAPMRQIRASLDLCKKPLALSRTSCTPTRSKRLTISAMQRTLPRSADRGVSGLRAPLGVTRSKPRMFQGRRAGSDPSVWAGSHAELGRERALLIGDVGRGRIGDEVWHDAPSIPPS